MRSPGRSCRIRTSLAALLAALLLAALPAAAVTGCGEGAAPVVTLTSGQVSGAAVDGVNRYLGIPYAAPPVGELRWKPPQPAEPWEGVRECTEAGPVCPQVEFIQRRNGAPQSEDCLYLNVWTPAERSGEKLPVMFWIHGGAYQMGAGSLPLYDGEDLAKRGVVVVTINYRLGPFGFLAHPQLTAESQDGSSGNYGMLDQQAALQWVKENIEAFGGDPGCVTIFGESAGAMSVMNHLVSPLSSGLFHRAISESTLFIDRGLLMRATRPLAEAEEIGTRYAADIGCSGGADQLASLRAKTAGELLGIPDGRESDLKGSIEVLTDPGLFIMDPRFVPVVDGWVLPEEPGAVVASGGQHDVPLLIGSNREEGNLFTFAKTLQLDRMPVTEYEDRIRRYFGEYADEVLAMFPVRRSRDIKRQLSRIYTVFDFTSVARFAARSQAALGQDVFLYRFSRRDPDLLGLLGPCHGSELPFVFGNLVTGDLPDGAERSLSRILFSDAVREFRKGLIGVFGQEDIRLSDEMTGYWTRFAKTGDPNCDGAFKWPRYEEDTDLNIELAVPLSVERGLEKEACDLADRFYGYDR